MRPLHLTVIAKEPVAGRVKTRLVPPLTHESAAAVARVCLDATFAAVDATIARSDGIRAVALIDGAAGAWIPTNYHVVEQRGDGLGERLTHGFDELGPGLIIGMDTPSCGPLLGEALDALRTGSDCLGMTLDGGYWGIGLVRPDPAVFDGVPMSTDHTGRDQLRRLRELGRSVRILPTVRDLDEIGDLDVLVAEFPALAAAAGRPRRKAAGGREITIERTPGEPESTL